MTVAVVEMEVDEEMYPIETVINFGMYQELKPPEKPEKNNEKKENRGDFKLENNTTTRIYKIYKEVEKEQLWIANDQRDPQTYTARKEGRVRPVDRPAVMDDRHKTHLVDLIDEEPALVLDQMMDSLTPEFIDLEISKTALAYFHSDERNCLEKITARKEWVEKWMATDMDYMSNCVFIDEAAFHINMKRSIAWAKTTTILGATCAFGVVNIKVRRPRVMPTSKKRKTAGSSGQAQTQSKGTVTGHYFNFISDTMDEMDKHPEIFKDNYLIMDNAPIHTNDAIKLLNESRGYRCVYLPPYSPDLNPIEQFWSICKSKLKREKLLKEETLTSRIGDACNQVLIASH
ncbi:hypothetical protein [Parasitella parasitica]|uniref:Tc1-like transposase DDE domain-containing protein n=2 Tax=Parasitella parasitica TaxID=35722 RepID=A0A0B7N3A4_9FUNG|nr:hypothetical protein [Parasitella parasitica]